MDIEDPSYLERSRAAGSAADGAWNDFYSRLSPDERRMVDGLPSGDGFARHSGLEEDVAESNAASFREDLASAIDAPADILRDVFGLSAGQAEDVWSWHLSVVARTERLAKDAQLARLIGILIRPMKDVQTVIIGLAMASGHVGQMSLNGYRSGADAARRIGKHRATLSHWKRVWQKALHLRNETFGKQPRAKEKYRAARLAVVARQRNKMKGMMK